MLVNTVAFRQTDRMKYFLPLATLLFWAAGCTHLEKRDDLRYAIGHPVVALAPQVTRVTATNGMEQIYFSFCTDKTNRVPGILLKPANASGRRPVVIALHGTGGNKESMVELCNKFVERGFIAVAMDARYHGERRAGKGLEDYYAAIVRAWHGSGEHPLYYDTAWDVTRLVDYLETREDVDAQRIGLMGISKGGIETYFVAAAEPRIAVAVPCIGMQSFDWALKNNDWQGRIATIQPAFDRIAQDAGVAKPDSAFVENFYDRVVPGINSQFDGPQIMRLIAPRPLLIINGDSDIHTPLPGVQECVTAAEKIYTAEKATNHFSVIIQKNTGHKVLPESERAAIDWFVKWLKP